MATNSAQNSSLTALLNYEIAEYVLSCLDFADLLRSRGVCTRWQTLTTRSEVLRHTLFLESNVINSVRRDTSKQLLGQPGEMVTGTRRSRAEQSLRLNPLIKYTGREDSLHFACQISLRPSDVKRMLSWPDGLWQNMLVSFPPPERVNIRVGGARWSIDSAEIEDPKGIRLGTMVHRMLALLKADDGVEWRGDTIGSKLEIVGLMVHIYGLGRI